MFLKSLSARKNFLNMQGVSTDSTNEYEELVLFQLNERSGSMYRNLILILACYPMATLGCQTSTGQISSLPPHEESIDLLRVVVLDVSGSMDEADTKGLSRLGTARKEIEESLAQLPASNKAPVVLVPFCDKIREDFERIYFSTKAMEDVLDRIKASGRTNIAAGLGRAIERINQLGLAKNLVVYLYSDGEHNTGSKKLLEQQEDNLDRLFGFRASKGLSQTVVVKRWGGVIGKLVARLQKNPHVKVVDAGQLELRTVTLAPSAKIPALKWHDAASSLATVQLDVTVANRSGLALPGKTTIKISCPLPGSRWLNEPSMVVTGPTQTQTFGLVVKLDPKKLNLVKDYSLPLRFHWPDRITTDRSLLLPLVNPIQVYCVLPASQLRPEVTISANLCERGKPRWDDMDKCIVVWPMRLQLETTTKPSVAWSEQIKLNTYGLNGVEVTPNDPIILQGQSREVDINLTKKIPLDQVLQRKPVKLEIELRAANTPRTLALSSMRIVSTIQIELPAIQLTRIHQRISFVGKPQWADLTKGLVSVPVELAISSHGIVAPGTVLSLVPCKDVVRVDGTPVTIYPGQHTVDIILTGRVDAAGSQVKWPLQLKPPRPSYGVRYLEPQPVTVSFTAPGPVQAVLSNKAGILASCAYRGNKPQRTVSGTGCVKLAGAFAQCAVANLRIKGLLRGHLHGKGFSVAGLDDWVSWSMQPKNPDISVKLWRDVTVTGNLVVLPENAAPGAMLGSVIDITITYEALYKKVALYLTVGLVVVLVGTLLFCLARRMSPDMSTE
jgi:hypothetical protein